MNQGTPVVSMIDNDYFEVDVNIPSGDFIRREDFMTFHANADVCPDSILPLELLDITRGKLQPVVYSSFPFKTESGSGARYECLRYNRI